MGHYVVRDGERVFWTYWLLAVNFLKCISCNLFFCAFLIEIVCLEGTRGVLMGLNSTFYRCHHFGSVADLMYTYNNRNPNVVKKIKVAIRIWFSTKKQFNPISDQYQT